MVRRTQPHSGQTGYLSFAQDTPSTSYLDLAYAQGLSLKATQANAPYAVAVNPGTSIPDKYRSVFDYVVEIPQPSDIPFMDEYKAFYITPFKETFKLEADILFNSPNDHWWTGIRKHHHLLFTSRVMKYDGGEATSRSQRKLFDDNMLPNVYNGFMYFRYDVQTQEFFEKARIIFEHWPLYTTHLKGIGTEYPASTDVVYALAVKLLGIEDTCMNPLLDYPTFVHMKPQMQGLSSPWYESIHFTLDEERMTIGHHGQLYPLHYQNKEFMTDSIIKHYEGLLGIG